MPLRIHLTTVYRRTYPADVAETTATGFGDPIMMADDRRSAVFLRPYAFARLFNGWAWAGRPSGLPVPSCRFANPVQCPPTPFGDGTRVFLSHDGGRTMSRHAPARSTHKQSTVQFPLFVFAGRHAAELWLMAAPLSAGEFRDLRYSNLLAGVPTLPGDELRREAFNKAFARRIAEAIAHSKVKHG